jgi:hypothetical protein
MGIEFTATWRSLTGLGGTWSFNIPRVISDDSMVFRRLHRAVRYGSLATFQQTMELNRIRVFDVFRGHQIFALIDVSHRLVFSKPLQSDSDLSLVPTGHCLVQVFSAASPSARTVDPRTCDHTRRFKPQCRDRISIARLRQKTEAASKAASGGGTTPRLIWPDTPTLGSALRYCGNCTVTY